MDKNPLHDNGIKLAEKMTWPLPRGLIIQGRARGHEFKKGIVVWSSEDEVFVVEDNWMNRLNTTHNREVSRIERVVIEECWHVLLKWLLDADVDVDVGLTTLTPDMMSDAVLKFIGAADA